MNISSHLFGWTCLSTPKEKSGKDYVVKGVRGVARKIIALIAKKAVPEDRLKGFSDNFYPWRQRLFPIPTQRERQEVSESVFECTVVLPFSWKVLLDVLTLFLPVVYNVGMKKQQEEMTIEFMDELDLSRVPKDIFDAFLEALEEAIEEVSVK